MNYFLDVLRNKYADFSGRARRSEYWYFQLFSFLISLALTLMDTFLGFNESGFGILSGIFSLALLIPSLAVGVRRLHDTGRSGWFLLIGLIPLIGAIILLVFFFQDSDPGENAYGPNPKDPYTDVIDEIGNN
ncbi:MAG: DUF805 domain-containing protein [Bacteroidia bacterium]|nr:DUF805 domain-containing protein [Bacteroidia bacterium]